ncbi:MAG: flagellar basal body L-ring protein FlgH [Planctomycetes bacterium]|nr:flagellar basal body L-ring protein FlgH [Planctomycetota bacterium]
MKRLVLLLLFLGVCGRQAPGESLWAAGARSSLIRDTKAREVGDLLTITIDERAAVSKESSRSGSKEEASEFAVELFKLFGWEGKAPNLPSIKWDSKREYDGEAEFSSNDTFTKRLTVIVKELLPNGNLLVEGTHELQTDGDETTITISGIVRPIDILENNTVPSEFVADAKITYNSTGPTARSSKRGWFTRLLDFIWPF